MAGLERRDTAVQQKRKSRHVQEKSVIISHVVVDARARELQYQKTKFEREHSAQDASNHHNNNHNNNKANAAKGNNNNDGKVLCPDDAMCMHDALFDTDEDQVKQRPTVFSIFELPVRLTSLLQSKLTSYT